MQSQRKIMGQNTQGDQLARLGTTSTSQKMKFSIKDFFSKCDQIRRKLRIWLHLLKKSLLENFFFCAVFPDISQFPKIQSLKMFGNLYLRQEVYKAYSTRNQVLIHSFIFILLYSRLPKKKFVLLSISSIMIDISLTAVILLKNERFIKKNLQPKLKPFKCRFLTNAK